MYNYNYDVSYLHIKGDIGDTTYRKHLLGACNLNNWEDDIIKIQDDIYDKFKNNKKFKNLIQKGKKYGFNLPFELDDKYIILPVDERFKETPRAFPVKSNRRATFDTVPGSMSGFGSTRPGTGRPATGGTGSGQVGTMQVQTDPAKEAAKKRFDESKKAYEAALEKAKKTPRSFMAETKDPSYAQNPDSMFIPQIINAPDN